MVALMTTDTHGSVSQDTSLVSVVDTTAPTFGPLPSLTIGVCGPSSQSAIIPIPVAIDACSSSVAVTGAIVASNGVTLATPIVIENGTASLGVGSYTIKWNAKDESGSISTAEQSLNVRPAIQASDSISVDDRSIVALPGGGFAAIGNTGIGSVTVGVQAQTGEIDTKGGVFLRNNALVHGGIRAAGAVTTQTGATVSGLSVRIPPPPAILQMKPGARDLPRHERRFGNSSTRGFSNAGTGRICFNSCQFWFGPYSDGGHLLFQCSRLGTARLFAARPIAGRDTGVRAEQHHRSGADFAGRGPDRGIRSRICGYRWVGHPGVVSGRCRHRPECGRRHFIAWFHRVCRPAFRQRYRASTGRYDHLHFCY